MKSEIQKKKQNKQKKKTKKNNNNNKKEKKKRLVELLIPIFFRWKSFSWEDKNFFGQNYGEVVLNWRTNDQIMLRFGRSFINIVTRLCR